MHKVEIQEIKRSYKAFNSIDEYCFKARLLYDYVNYILRKNYEVHKKIPKEYDLIPKLRKRNNKFLRLLPSGSAGEVVKLLYKSWKSFFKIKKEYHKDKLQFLWRRNVPKAEQRLKENPNFGMPTPPKMRKYKGNRGVFLVNYTESKFDESTNSILLSNKNFEGKFPPMKMKTSITKKQYKQIRFIPRYTKKLKLKDFNESRECDYRPDFYSLEIVYEDGEEIEDGYYDKTKFLVVDLGVKNLLTVVTNDADVTPMIIRGDFINNINEFFNHKKALYQSFVGDKGTSKRIRKFTRKRDNIIKTYMHKVSKYIINICKEYKIGNIIIGKNKGWKQGVNIGKRNNRKFVGIPYNKLVQDIKYKAEFEKIEVIEKEESYTSKCDALAMEPIEKHDTYLGKRVKRGLFRSSTGILLNADVNAAINILRKAVGDDAIAPVLDISKVTNPLIVDIDDKEIKINDRSKFFNKNKNKIIEKTIQKIDSKNQHYMF